MSVLGLDIGGVNIKTAHGSGGAWVVPFRVCEDPGLLCEKLTSVAALAGAFDQLAVTMTAELCDCFETKRQGVGLVLAAVEMIAHGRPIGVWSTQGRFVTPDEARRTPLNVAAANWHALATYAASLYPQGLTLLVDTGSTTTDIVRLDNGCVDSDGLTDTQRLATGELVYIGARHTPLATLGPTIPWRGRDTAITADWFASTADVFLLTGDLPEDPACTDTPDGRPETRTHAAVRIVRMIGADLETLTAQDARELAGVFAGVMRRRIGDSIKRIASADTIDRVLITGSGSFLAQQAAKFALPGVPRVLLADAIGEAASIAACAYAVAKLATAPTHIVDTAHAAV